MFDNRDEEEFNREMDEQDEVDEENRVNRQQAADDFDSFDAKRYLKQRGITRGPELPPENLPSDPKLAESYRWALGQSDDLPPPPQPRSQPVATGRRRSQIQREAYEGRREADPLERRSRREAARDRDPSLLGTVIRVEPGAQLLVLSGGCFGLMFLIGSCGLLVWFAQRLGGG